MNVTFHGYLSFNCKHCNTPHSVEGQTLLFEPDTSAEALDDPYIRYLTQLNMPCPECSQAISIKFDVWEHPEAVVNYAYYDERGAHNIQCEFHIEHYFDDQAVKEEDLQYDLSPEPNDDTDDENDQDDDFTPNIEGYLDRYDDEDQ